MLIHNFSQTPGPKTKIYILQMRTDYWNQTKNEKSSLNQMHIFHNKKVLNIIHISILALIL